MLPLTFIIPMLAYPVMRALGRCDAANAGAVAAHHGSVSTANFFASMSFSRAMGRPAERGRGILLLTGGMVIGAVASEPQWRQIAPFWEGMFRGFLMLFLLEMGMTAARQIRGFAAVAGFMTGFGILFPILGGLAGVTAGYLSGMSLGGAFVLGAICASASFIDAPAACRAAWPEANPGITLTASLGVTLPFNLLFGLPLHYQYTVWLFGAGGAG